MGINEKQVNCIKGIKVRGDSGYKGKQEQRVQRNKRIMGADVQRNCGYRVTVHPEVQRNSGNRGTDSSQYYSNILFLCSSK